MRSAFFVRAAALLSGVTLITFLSSGCRSSANDASALTRENASTTISASLTKKPASSWIFNIREIVNPADVGILVRQGYLSCAPQGACLLTDKGVKASTEWNLRKLNGAIEWVEIPYARRTLIAVTGVSMPTSPNAAEVIYTWQNKPINEIGTALAALHKSPNDRDQFDDRIQTSRAFFQKFDDGWRLVDLP